MLATKRHGACCTYPPSLEIVVDLGGDAVDSLERCYFCGRLDGRIVPWFVQTERRSIHMPCWLAAYGTDDEAGATTDIAA